MRCPICRKEFDATTSTSKPFCSARCRSIDLGRWIDETYGLPHVPDPEADERPPDDATATNGVPHDD